MTPNMLFSANVHALLFMRFFGGLTFSVIKTSVFSSAYIGSLGFPAFSRVTLRGLGPSLVQLFASLWLG